MYQNNPSNSNSTFVYSPMSPTVPFFLRHFYPIGYIGEAFFFPESGHPAADSKEVRASWPFILISLSVYLLLGLLFVTLILWSNRHDPEHTQPAAPEVHGIWVSQEAIPHPPYRNVRVLIPIEVNKAVSQGFMPFAHFKPQRNYRTLASGWGWSRCNSMGGCDALWQAFKPKLQEKPALKIFSSASHLD